MFPSIALLPSLVAFLSKFDRSCTITLPTLSFLSLTLSLTVPRTTHSSVSNLRDSATSLPSTSHSRTTTHPFLSSNRLSRLPSRPTLAHHNPIQQQLQPPSSERGERPPVTSFYPPTSTSAPDNTSRPLPATFPSTTSLSSSMIVSALSFYDPAQASSIPDYPNSRWDTSFDSFSDAVHNPLPSRDSAFHAPPGSNSSSASTSGAFFHSEIPSSSHRTSTFSRSSPLHAQPPIQPQHQSMQHRQMVPIPRRQRDPQHHHPTETQSQVQTRPLSSRQEQGQILQEQTEAESQVRPLSVAHNLRTVYLY